MSNVKRSLTLITLYTGIDTVNQQQSESMHILHELSQ